MLARLRSPIGVGFIGALVWLVTGCDHGTGGPGPVDPPDPGLDIGEALAAIDGVVTVAEQASAGRYRRFAISFEQPADHGDPAGPRFTQQLTLMHRDREAPVVLATTGYHDFLGGNITEPAALLDANQIVVEHRYFGSSRPEPLDWAHLDIEQAAADHHRIVEALAPIYTGAWISTGASKGGAASIFHRRFYPDDVVATVAYVAPVNLDVDDERYEAFFDDSPGDPLGDTIDPDCRQRVRDYQREVLMRRAALEPHFAELAAQQGYTFERLDGVARAFETTVVELEWTFWQYMGISACDLVPGTTASDADIAGFLDATEALWTLSDQQIAIFEPYYYQSLTQLGYPSIPVEHIADLLRFDYEAGLARLLPPGVTAVYDPAPMRDIAGWVASEGERLVLVYGAHDPWTAGALDLGQARDSYLLIAPSTNHDARLGDLPGEVHEQVADALHEWTQTQYTSPMPAGAAAAPATLEELRASLRERFPARPRLGL